MSQDYYILKTLNMKDENIHFYNDFVNKETILTCKSKFHRYLFKYGTYFYKQKSGI